MTPGQQQIVMSRPIDVGIGGSGLTTGMNVQGPAFDGAGFDLSYPDTNEQVRIRDTVTAANNYRGPAQGKLTYTSPSVKMTRRSNGQLTATNGTTELPFEWDASGVLLGLLCEAAATNLAIKSQTMDTATATWALGGTATLTSDDTTAPDGTVTGDKFTDSASGSISHQGTGSGITVTSGSTYTVSVYAKKSTTDWFRLVHVDFTTGANGCRAWFNLNTGALGSNATIGTGWTFVSSSIQDAGRGWYRCSLTVTVGATASFLTLCTADADASNTRVAGAIQWYWGFQLELGSFATSYIVTTTATVTRAVDNITLATSALPFSATVGSLYAKFRPRSTAAIRFAGAFDGAANNRIAVGSSAAAAGYFSIIATSEQIGPMTAGTATANLDSKIAGGWVANRAEQATNGTLATVDTSVTLPTVTSLGFGTGSSAASPLNGWLSQLAYYKRTLADAELQTLTRVL